MVRIRSGWLVVVLALGLGASACKKNDDKKGDQPATGDKMAETGGLPALDKGGATPVAVGGDDLSLLPVDSEVVIGINFAQLQSSSIWKQFVAPKLATADLAGMQKFKALCGFDPLESLKSISIGLKDLSGNNPNGAIVVHGYDKTKSMTCFDKDGVSDVEKDGSKVTIDGDVVMIKDKSGKQMGFTFVNDSTALAVIGPDAATKDGIKKVAGGGGALKTSATFVEMYGKINTGDSVWMLMNGNSPVLSKMGAMGVKPKALFGSLNITDGLAVDMRLRLSSPDEVTQFVKMAKGQTDNPQVKQMFDKLDVTADGSDAKFSVGMSAAKLQALIGMVGGMMGGMMGAGGAGGGMGGPGGP